MITRAAGGDEAAQRALYERHHAASFRLTCLLLHNTCDAEEVVQDAFVYVFRNLHRYDAERGSFWTWLRVILVSRCRNKHRRRRPALVPLETLDVASPEPADPAQLLEMRGAQRAVWEALQQVSQGAREALVLRYYESLPYAEISELLGCSPAAARARVAHGKVQLRRLLSASHEEPSHESAAAHAVKAG